MFKRISMVLNLYSSSLLIVLIHKPHCIIEVLNNFYLKYQIGKNSPTQSIKF